MSTHATDYMTDEQKFEEMKDLLTTPSADAPDAPEPLDQEEQIAFFFWSVIGVLGVISVWLYGSGILRA